ncbi:MAG TPA: hypothetical protein VK717_03570 [Opitutaceae bacterium]|jgi:hypothetical protein|nr:hypothetical protein [Opitutaceae bacterium]
MKHYKLMWISASLILFVTGPAAFASAWEVNVNTEMTPEGKKLPHPTPDHPAYYFPKVVGYNEIGAVTAGAKKPLDPPTIHLLAQALAAQGYLVTQVNGDKFDPPPSLILIFKWGQVNVVNYIEHDVHLPGTPPDDPGIDVPEYDTPALKTELMFIGAQKELTLGADEEKISQYDSAVRDPRYFVTVTAYDFDAFYRQHKAVALWVSRMSVPQGHFDLADTLPALINSGAPFFGRETEKPQWLNVPEGAQGKVDVAAPVVKEYITPAGPGSAPPPPGHP